MSQFELSGGSTQEILQPGSKTMPMIFCPALTSAVDPQWDEIMGEQRPGPPAFDFRGGPGFRQDDFESLAPAMQAGSPSGLFSQLAPHPGGFLQ